MQSFTSFSAPSRTCLSPAWCSYRRCQGAAAGGSAFTGRARRLAVRAQGGDQQSQQGQTGGDKESMLEALEAQARARKGAKAAQLEAQRPPASQQRRAGQAPKVVWKEGQLLPEGWDQMDLPTKLYQLYMGERGFMFWSGKAALASTIFLAVAWVAFRVVGPALGLYQLASDFQQPNF